MAVFPFYVEVNSNSRANRVGVGAKTKQAYMETFIYQRDEGEITTPFKIVQRMALDEESKVYKLYTEVYHNGKLLTTHTTNYRYTLSLFTCQSVD